MIIEVENLKKEFVQGTQKIEVLKDVNFNLKSGEVTAVVGPSGSGKTTLLSLLAGLDRPSSGQIRLNGQPFSSLNEADRTQFRGKNVGIVFQSYHLIPHLTCLENVQLPLEILGRGSNAKAGAEAWLQKVGLSHRLDHFPSQMSGGECQRAALARALVIEPTLLLADEPSGHLDQKTGERVMDLLFQMIRENKITTILVTHDSTLAKRCDRQLVLNQGELKSL